MHPIAERQKTGSFHLRQMLSARDAPIRNTGAGKTYTMNMAATPPPVAQTGEQPTDEDNRGIAPRIICDLFDNIKAQGKQCYIICSFYEIYKEKIYDLLDQSKGALHVKENETGFYVENLTTVEVQESDDVLSIIKYGAGKRRVAATAMNADSSRSHTILCLTIKTTDEEESMEQVAKLQLVDLAGSERVKTITEGSQLQEAKSINQSLATLGKVICSLTDGSVKHVPYRESKLTKLLMDGLGGNSRTCLVLNCSPSSTNYDETISTLRFGASAKLVKNKARVNVSVVHNQNRTDMLLKEKDEEIARLLRANATLEMRISAHVDKASAISSLQRQLQQTQRKLKRKDHEATVLRTQMDNIQKVANTYLQQQQKGNRGNSMNRQSNEGPLLALANISAGKPFQTQQSAEMSFINSSQHWPDIDDIAQLIDDDASSTDDIEMLAYEPDDERSEFVQVCGDVRIAELPIESTNDIEDEIKDLQWYQRWATLQGEEIKLFGDIRAAKSVSFRLQQQLSSEDMQIFDNIICIPIRIGDADSRIAMQFDDEVTRAEWLRSLQSLQPS